VAIRHQPCASAGFRWFEHPLIASDRKHTIPQIRARNVYQLVRNSARISAKLRARWPRVEYSSGTCVDSPSAHDNIRPRAGQTVLEKIRLTNFKAFEHQVVSCAPITVFLGPNNSGKSSIIAALRLLAQTMTSPDASVPLLMNGDYGDFGTFRDVVYRNHRGKPFAIELTFTPARTPLGPNPRTRTDQRITFRVQYKFRTQRRELILNSFSLHSNDGALLETEYSRDSEQQQMRSIGGAAVPPALKGLLSQRIRMDHFLPDVYRMRTHYSQEDAAEVASFDRQTQETLERTVHASWAIRRFLGAVDYLGPMRYAPLRTYQFTGERRNRIGMHGENVAGILAMDWANRSRTKESIAKKVENWLSEAGIASALKVSPISDRHYEVRISHPVTGETENIADVGYGNSQVIPVLVGGFIADKDSVFLVEEPEIHLHPKAQAELGTFFAGLRKSRVQTIIETHSEHLVVRLQQHVAAQHISPEDVAVYYLSSSASDGKTATRLRLDENGKFVDEWPDGFFPERLEEAKRLSMIRHGQMKLPFRLRTD